jgi:hypothetical protein
MQSDIEAQSVINDKVNEKPILLVSMFDGNTRIFDRMIDGKTLDFEQKDGKIFDLQTSSKWSYDGVALDGPLEGKKLIRLAIEPGFWFEWVAFHPETLVFVP